MAAKKLRVGEAAEATNQESHEARMLGMEKSLAKQGKRIVAMTDVTVTKEKLVAAVRKAGKLPGNEIPAFVDLLLKEIIMG